MIKTTLAVMALVAKYAELLKEKTSSLDDTITVEQSINLLGEAAKMFLTDIQNRLKKEQPETNDKAKTI